MESTQTAMLLKWKLFGKKHLLPIFFNGPFSGNLVSNIMKLSNQIWLGTTAKKALTDVRSDGWGDISEPIQADSPFNRSKSHLSGP